MWSDTSNLIQVLWERVTKVNIVKRNLEMKQLAPDIGDFMCLNIK